MTTHRPPSRPGRADTMTDEEWAAEGASGPKDVVLRSSPNNKRPKLPEDAEDRLFDLERQTAACYADAEDKAARLASLAEAIDRGDAVVEIPMEAEESAIHHLMDARSRMPTAAADVASATKEPLDKDKDDA